MSNSGTPGRSAADAAQAAVDANRLAGDLLCFIGKSLPFGWTFAADGTVVSPHGARLKITITVVPID